MKKIGELLVEQGKISERDVERTLLAQAEMGGVFGQVLVKLGLVSEADVASALSVQLSVALLATADYPESPIRLEGVAQDFLQFAGWLEGDQVTHGTNIAGTFANAK